MIGLLSYSPRQSSSITNSSSIPSTTSSLSAQPPQPPSNLKKQDACCCNKCNAHFSDATILQIIAEYIPNELKHHHHQDQQPRQKRQNIPPRAAHSRNNDDDWLLCCNNKNDPNPSLSRFVAEYQLAQLNQIEMNRSIIRHKILNDPLLIYDVDLILLYNHPEYLTHGII